MNKNYELLITETHENVKHVAADGVADGHVPVALLDHGHAGEAVGDTDPGGDEGESHHGVRDPEGEAHHSDHPDHDVAVHADPGHGDQEGKNKPERKSRL